MADKYHFFYNKKIDKTVIEAVSFVLGVPVIKAIKMKHGEVNHVYKILTEQRNFLVRVFKNKDWPEPGKLPWIEKQLAKYKIPHAKTLYYSKGKKFFPNGFMVTEFIEGLNGEQAVEKHQLTLGQAYFNIGKILKKVHKIQIKRFGLVSMGQGNNASLLNWKVKEDIRKRFRQLEKTPIPKNLEPIVTRQVELCLKPFEKRFKPVLNHGDPNRGNCILSKDKRWILIDWDNAISSSWLEDYSDLTFWADFKKNKSFTSRRLKIFNKNFFIGYGKVAFSWEEIKRIERGFHIIKCMRLLPYYYFGKRSISDFSETKRKLLKLIDLKS